MTKVLLFQLLLFLLIPTFTATGQLKIKQDPVLVKIMDSNNNFDKHTDFGGLSAIEYSGIENIYYTVADKPPFRIYTLKIDIEKETIHYQITDTLVFNDLKFEAEGIRVIDSLSYFFVSDEQNTSTSVFKFSEGHMLKIDAIPSLKNVMRVNSGYEGLTLSTDKKSLYFALERPFKKDKRKKYNQKDKSFTSIFEYDIENDKIVNEYAYPLVNPSGDNGVSEILTLNDSMLLIMERAWTNNQSIVTINKVNLQTAGNILAFKKRIPDSTQFLTPETLIDFGTIEKNFTRYPSYNFEGMTLAHTGRHILFITDNNFSPNQTTYLVILEIEL